MAAYRLATANRLKRDAAGDVSTPHQPFSSRPCTCAGGAVASMAVKGSMTR